MAARQAWWDSLAMLRGYESYSFRHGKRRTRRLLGSVVRYIVILLVLYLIVTEILIISERIATNSMAPTFLSNERVIAAPVAYGIRIPFSLQRVLETGRPKRGDVVVIQPPYLEKESEVQRILNPLVQFFTLQQRRLYSDRLSRGAGNHLIKRIVGVPGDTIVLKELIAYIKPVNQVTFHRESDLIPFDYEIRTEGFKTNWPKDLPFSGNANEIELSETEYFVLGDNRNSSSDSRSWGPITVDRIIAKVILRYWPLSKLGSP